MFSPLYGPNSYSICAAAGQIADGSIVTCYRSLGHKGKHEASLAGALYQWYNTDDEEPKAESEFDNSQTTDPIGKRPLEIDFKIDGIAHLHNVDEYHRCYLCHANEIRTALGSDSIPVCLNCYKANFQ